MPAPKEAVEALRVTWRRWDVESGFYQKLICHHLQVHSTSLYGFTA